MRFRTEIEQPPRDTARIPRGARIVMLGSCFTDNIGQKLDADGFCVTHNPMGPLYNPLSLETVVCRAVRGPRITHADLVADADGSYHCLSFASRYQHADPGALLEMVNADFDVLSADLTLADTVVLTLGTSYVFFMADSGKPVGNCHKFVPQTFTRRRITIDEAADSLRSICQALAPRRVIFTVSPVRHTADTLHGNQLSKATLLLAVDALCAEGLCEYFPAYEILIDDLRDYRFCAADLKHPSDTAVEYIYSHFCDTYFTPETMQAALASRKDALRAAHVNKKLKE